MTKQLPKTIQFPSDVLHVVDRIWHHGYQAYLVGGCVRDTLLGKTPKDYDIATDMLPCHIDKLFDHVVATGLQHGTMTVVLNDNNYEITTFRKDVDCDGRHATVEFTDSFEEDCRRRDFTINAMGIDTRTNTLYDFFNGEEDLQKKIIRTVGDAEARFEEDKLRMLRAFRFSAVLGFDISSDIEIAIKRHAETISRVSQERIRDEILKLLSCAPEDLSPAIYGLIEVGLMKHILPEVDRLFNFSQLGKWHKLNVLDHSLDVCQKIMRLTDDPFLRFMALIHDVGKFTTRGVNEHGNYNFHGHEVDGGIMVEEICTRLKMTAHQIHLAKWLIDRHLEIKNLRDMQKRAMARYVRRNEAHLDALLLLGQADTELDSFDDVVAAIRAMRDEIAQGQPKIQCLLNGKQIMEIMRLSPGPEVGMLKDLLIELQLIGMLKTEQDAVAHLTYMKQLQYFWSLNRSHF